MLYVKYRPTEVEELLGKQQRKAAEMLIGQRPKLVLLTGPTGVGKTTIGKIYAASLGVGPIICNCRKIGVADVRELLEKHRARSIKSEYTVIFLDEVDAFSNQAQQGFLGIEDFPPHLFVIATTKNKETLRPDFVGRFMHIDLPSPPKKEVGELIARIIDEEGFVLTPEQRKALWDKIPVHNISVREAITWLEEISSGLSIGTEDAGEENTFYTLINDILAKRVISSLPVAPNNGQLTAVCIKLVEAAVKRGDLAAISVFGGGLSPTMPEVTSFYRLVADYYRSVQ